MNKYPEASEVGPVTPELFQSRRAEWVKYLAVEEGAPENTCNTYARELKRFSKWLEDGPHTIERDTLANYRDDLTDRYSPATVNLSLVAVRRYLDWLAMQGDIPYNPAARVKGVRARDQGHSRKRDDLAPAEVKRVLSIIDTGTAKGKRDLAIVCAMAYGALRQSEVQRAQIGDYQTKRSRPILWIREKEDSEPDDYIVVHSTLKAALTDWIDLHPQADDPGAALFCSLHARTYGEVLTTRHIRRIVKECLLAAGINDASKTTDSLRHSAIAAVIRAGGSLVQVQRVARHRNPMTTEKYIYDYDRLEDPAEFLIEY
ncbi:MAG: tyrosine-type recombinase/integrase [Chloroflexota bacterium]